MVATISAEDAVALVTGSLKTDPWELPPAKLAEIVEEAKKLLTLNFFHDRLRSIRQILLEGKGYNEGIRSQVTSDEIIFAGLPNGMRHNMTFLRCAWVTERPIWQRWTLPLVPTRARTILLSRQLKFYVLDVRGGRHGGLPSTTTDQWYEATEVVVIPADLPEEFKLFTEIHPKRGYEEDHPVVQILWAFHSAQQGASEDLQRKHCSSEQRERALGGYLRRLGSNAFSDYL